MTPTTADILHSPDWHLMGFEGEFAVLAPMTRETYARSAFLDRRAELAGGPIRVPLRPFLDAADDVEIPACGWIFHVAHCGSTLLTRLIETESRLVLREPPALRQLGLEVASNRRSPDWTRRLRLAALLAARRYDPAIPTVIKANVPVNFIIGELTSLQGSATEVMLHFELEPYLLAILHSPQHRGWVDRITSQLAPVLPRFSVGASLAVKAASLWLGQTRQFAELTRSSGAARRLDAELFFADPLAAARRTSKHFASLDGAIAPDAGDLLGHYSKNPARAFSEQDRRKRQAVTRALIEDELNEAKRWLDTQQGLPVTSAIPSLE